MQLVVIAGETVHEPLPDNWIRRPVATWAQKWYRWIGKPNNVSTANYITSHEIFYAGRINFRFGFEKEHVLDKPPKVKNLPIVEPEGNNYDQYYFYKTPEHVS